MSSRKNTQLVLAGLVAAATIGFVLYYSSAPSTGKAKEDVGTSDEKETNDVEKEVPSSKAPSTSAEKSDRAETPKRSNVTDQKELHSKIEELDKKGKALFKAKKVCFYL